MIRRMARGTTTVPDAAATNAVLSSAADCFVRLGVTRTTATDIARGAGISRATLYRRYGGTVEIFLAVLARESAEICSDAAELLASVTDPSARLIQGMIFAIGEVQRRYAAVPGPGDLDQDTIRRQLDRLLAPAVAALLQKVTSEEA
jgi:AcrR family transcriptional regulator